MACPMSMHHLPKLETPPVFTHTSILFLSIPIILLIFTALISNHLLHKSIGGKTRILFTWHLFSALTHLLLESTYLFNVFFVSMSKLDATYTRGLHSSSFTPVNIHFLNDSKRLYGSFYGDSIIAKLWQEYAKADKRWGGSDLTIIGVELMAVFVLAPLGIYVCRLLREGRQREAWFGMAAVAVGELYGGFMVVVPESLSGVTNLDVGNWLTECIYLGLFKLVWTLVPIWVLGNSYRALTSPSSLNACMVDVTSEAEQPSKIQSSSKTVEGHGKWYPQQETSHLRPLVLSE